MLKGNKDAVQPEPATMPGAQGASIQWLVAGPQGAENFYMRRIIIEEGGQVPVHDHAEEHEIFVLTGEGEAQGPEGETVPMKPGDFFFIPGGERHRFTNVGQGELTFICCINKV